MATISDTLQTILRLEGASTYQAGLSAVSRSLDQMGVAEAKVISQSGGVSGSFAMMGGEAGILVGAVTLVIGVLAKALSEFSKSEDTIGRLTIRMRNLGNAFPIKDLVAFSGALGDQLGIDDESIAKLGALAAGWGLNRAQIERLLPKVLDIAVGLDKDPEEVLNRLLRASRGRTQGLIGLGIDPSKIKGDLHDIDNLINQVGASFEGTAAAFRDTLPATVKAFGIAVGNLLEAIGRFISPAVVPLLNNLIIQIQGFTILLTRIADYFHIPTAADIGGNKNPNDIALKGDPEQTDLMRQTANNTKRLNDEFVQRVLGGPGVVAKGAWTQRDAVMAFGI